MESETLGIKEAKTRAVMYSTVSTLSQQLIQPVSKRDLELARQAYAKGRDAELSRQAHNVDGSRAVEQVRLVARRRRPVGGPGRF